MPSPLPIIRRRKQRRERRQHSTSRRLLLVVLGVGFIVSVVLAMGIFGLASAWSRLTSDLPPTQQISLLLDPASGQLLQPTRLYDRTGEHLLAELSPPGITRKYVRLGQLPTALADATLASADPTFRSHPGCRLNGSATLATRLATDLLLWQEPASSRRSLRACLLALQLTDTYGRDQILAWYLNSADFGNYAYGADVAAQLYFGKRAGELDLAESALLAAVSQSPALNPFDAPEAAIASQHELLSRMAIFGMITPSTADKATAEPLRFQSAPAPLRLPTNSGNLGGEKEGGAPAFVNLTLDELAALFPRERIERGGLEVTTSLDFDLQQQAECLTRIQLASASGESPGTSDCAAARDLPALTPFGDLTGLRASLAVTDPQTGEVLALVGDTSSDVVEAAAMQDHPAGSLIAPFVYLTAFTRGAGPASLVWDIPGGLSGLPVDLESPGEQFHGPVRLREAMAGGYWVPAAEDLLNLGAESVAGTAAPFGLDLQPDPTDALALLTGAQPLSPLELAQAYGIFAADGILAGQAAEESLHPSTVLRVEGADHALWLDQTLPQKQAVVSAPLAFLVDNVLSEGAGLDRPAALVHGRTLDSLDTWAAGYTPRRSVAVWAGAETPVPAEVSEGLWRALAQAASNGLPPDGWEQPAGVTAMQVCDPSGLLPTPACPSVVKEFFLTGSEPVDADNLFVTYPVNRETGFLATVFTPLGLVEQRTYLLVPEAARDWAASAGLATPPQNYDTIQYSAPGGQVDVTSPEMFAEGSGQVTVTGSAAGENFLFYRLQFGAGLNPQAWYQIGEDTPTPVADGTLGEWDTTGLNGLYVLQLQVVYLDQTSKTASVVVNLTNPISTP
jgi:membrane peptidoglycan carboxypeptidase